MGVWQAARPALQQRAHWLARLAIMAFVLGSAASVAERGAARAETWTQTVDRAAGAPRASAPRAPLRVVWAGDIVLGSDAGAAEDNGRALFMRVTDQLRSADLAIGNLEGTLTQRGYSKCGGSSGGACFAFRAPQSTASALRHAGFDALNTANNHAYDYGQAGFEDTRMALGAARLAATGAPDEVTVVRAGGYRVALVGFSTYPWSADLRDLGAVGRLVSRARAAADIVIVTMHAGAEGTDQTHVPEGREVAFGEDRGDTRGFAHAAVDAGADLVLGSGPHVLRGIERYRDRLIAYSLGDFAAWGVLPTGGVMGLSGMLEVDLAPSGRPLEGRFTSLILQSPGIPVDDRDRQAARLVSELGAEDFGEAGVRIDRYGRLELRRARESEPAATSSSAATASAATSKPL